MRVVSGPRFPVARGLSRPLVVASLWASVVACQANRRGPKGPDDENAPASDAQQDPRALKTMSVDGTRCDATGRRVQQLDLNHDQRADIITLSRSTDTGDKITCKQADLNFDGRLDAFFHYGDDGDLVREQFDLDFDGRIDMGRFYENGSLTLDEQDLDQDGATDTWRRYDKGRLLRIENDRDADGRADMFTFYVGSQIDRIGYDVNGDGKVDRWDHDAARRARAALEARARPVKASDTPNASTEPEYVDAPDDGAKASTTDPHAAEPDDTAASGPPPATPGEQPPAPKKTLDANAKRSGGPNAARDQPPSTPSTTGSPSSKRPTSPNATPTPVQRPKPDKGASAPGSQLK